MIFKKPEWKPILMVVSAPSGAGKTTLCDKLIAEFHSIVYSVSCTTRRPRVGEVHGKSYFFLSEAEFDERIAAGDFLEHANVHGCRYGTPRSAVLDAIRAGRDVLMDIDVQGAANVRSAIRNAPEGDPLRQAYVDVFIAPPSLEDLQLRLFGRGKDEIDVINRRLQQAEQEMSRWREYQYLILNERVEESYAIIRSIYVAEHYRIRAEEASP